MAGTEAAKLVDMTQPAVSKALQRGEKLALENNFDFIPRGGFGRRITHGIME